jgi:hypothetical protein
MDLPLREPEPVVEEPGPDDAERAAEPAPSRPGRAGLAIGMLVLGLLAGFGAGFVVGQRLTVPSPPRAVEVPRPAIDRGSGVGDRGSGVRDRGPGVEGAVVPPPAPAPAVVEPAVAPVGDVVEPPAAEAPAVVQEPEVKPVVPKPAAPKPATPPPAPAVRAATVRFDSRPPGATIYLDEVRLGVTPLTTNTVAAGTHQVRMEMLGHDTWRTSVTVKEGEQLFVGASLE